MTTPAPAPDAFAGGPDRSDRTDLAALQAEVNAATERERRLRLTVQTSPIGIALVGLDGRWLEVNPAMAAIVGYSPQQLMQLRFQDITHPDDLARDLALLDEMYTGVRSSYQLDKRYLHADGHEVWVSLTASVVRDASGAPLHYLAQVQDITERRAALTALEAERDLSTALLGALHDGYAYLERGRMVVVNDVLCQMTGMTREQLLSSSTPFPFWSVEDEARDGGRLRKLINARTSHVEVQLRRVDGSVFDASIQVCPVRRRNGRISGYIALIRDITDRKQHERQLRHRADHDGLTGLLNRAAFHVRLTERVTAAQTTGDALSLAVLDLDDFKRVNDTFGHPAGDAVLREFADRMRSHSRDDDIVGRLGGEEFGWALVDTRRRDGQAAVLRMLEAMRLHEFADVGALTFSAGVAELRTGAAGESAQSLYRRADKLLYAAKQAGRNRVLLDTAPA